MCKFCDNLYDIGLPMPTQLSKAWSLGFIDSTQNMYKIGCLMETFSAFFGGIRVDLARCFHKNPERTFPIDLYGFTHRSIAHRVNARIFTYEKHTIIAPVVVCDEEDDTFKIARDISPGVTMDCITNKFINLCCTTDNSDEDNSELCEWEFTVTLLGVGHTQESAWEDAVSSFSVDLGEPHTTEKIGVAQ